MLRITPSSNAAGTGKYFKEALVKGDYYSGEKNTIGKWGGLAAEKLGLSGEVKQKDFIALLHNQKPDGSKLNPRNDANRKCGYDFTFSVPKSVSLAYALGGDDRIKQAFEKSVEETMCELETDMRTQAGRGKDRHYAKTSNMIWASFTHQTTRPIEGVPDPHLHIHAFSMNTTWNETKQRFQAGEFGTIKRMGSYYEAAADSRLSHKLVELGYQVERRGLSFEIVGIEDATCKKFSRRTEEIEQAASQEKAKQGGSLSAKQKAQLGALTRAKKSIAFGWEQLKEIWRSWLTDKEAKAIESAKESTQKREKPESMITASQAVEKAESHLLERKSVIKDFNLKAEALKRSFGQCLPEEIGEAVGQKHYYRKELKDLTLLTTKQALIEEQQLLKYLREAKGTQKPLNPEYEIADPILSEEQMQAVMHALTDRNAVTLISGKAGVGKTTLMREVKRGVEMAGKQFHAFAPTAAASRDVMRKEGFDNADTLASLLVSKEKQQQIKNGYVWIDESGLLGVKDMNALCQITKKQNARLLLTGDSFQHSAVARGDSLRLMEKESGLPVIRVSQIQRQRNNPRFKQVVAAASRGEIDKALHQLDRQGSVIEQADGKQRLQSLIEDYTLMIGLGKNCRIIAPTHIEGQNVTRALRKHLKENGLVKGKERIFTQLKNTHFSEEQKSDLFSYQSEHPLMVEFHQHAKGFKKGERFDVTSKGKESPRLKVGLASAAIPLDRANRFTLYRKTKLALAVGDKIRITKNTQSKEGTRLNNGMIYRIAGFTRKGDIKLHTGKTLSKDFGHIDYGWTNTSYSSQGATVDRVFLAMSSESVGATSQQQFYVSLSRAREGAKIYTDNKQELERAVMRDETRMSAREIALDQNHRGRREQSISRSHSLTQQTQSKSNGQSISL